MTGGAAGIGLATARRFAQEGCRVASWDVKDGEAQPGGIFQKVDVTSAASVESAVDEVAARLGAVYVLVNNAGILRDGQLIKYKDGALAGVMSDEQFDAVISVNLKGVFTCTRAVVPRMIAGGGGVILNAVQRGRPVRQFRPDRHYVATKARRDRHDQGVGARVGQVPDPRERARPPASSPPKCGRCRRPKEDSTARRAGRHVRRWAALVGSPRRRQRLRLVLASTTASFVTGTCERGRRRGHGNVGRREEGMKPIYIATFHQSKFGKLMGMTVPEIIDAAIQGACRQIGAEPAALDVGSMGAACNFSLNEQGLLAGLMATRRAWKASPSRPWRTPAPPAGRPCSP